VSETQTNKVEASASNCPNGRWGVILAGGEGSRLKALASLIAGDERPKQFCPLLGTETQLGETLRRAGQSIPPEQVLVSLNGDQGKWFAAEPELCMDRCIVQPSNRGTAPPVAHCILSIFRRDPDATVVILPSDHYYSDQESFTKELETAFSCAALRPASIVLLGALPDRPETEYGWIELGPAEGEHKSLFTVRAFFEKPPPGTARQMFEQGSLWNTFVMVGSVRSFLAMFQRSAPQLMEVLRDAPPWNGAELKIPGSLYQRMPAMDLSRRILPSEVEHLLVLRMDSVSWNDLGTPERVVATALDQGVSLDWADHVVEQFAGDSAQQSDRTEAG